MGATLPPRSLLPPNAQMASAQYARIQFPLTFSSIFRPAASPSLCMTRLVFMGKIFMHRNVLRGRERGQLGSIVLQNEKAGIGSLHKQTTRGSNKTWAGGERQKSNTKEGRRSDARPLSLWATVIQNDNVHHMQMKQHQESARRVGAHK